MLPRAIEEMLRYDGPVQSTARFPKSAIELAGVEIPAGSIVVVVIAAADPRSGAVSRSGKVRHHARSE